MPFESVDPRVRSLIRDLEKCERDHEQALRRIKFVNRLMNLVLLLVAALAVFGPFAVPAWKARKAAFLDGKRAITAIPLSLRRKVEGLRR